MNLSISFLIFTTMMIVISIRKTTAKKDSVCYRNLGCFKRSFPIYLYGNYSLLPEKPRNIGTEFRLYTRKNRDSFVLLKYNQGSVRRSPYKPDRPTIFIVHGFLSHSAHAWVKEMKDALLEFADYNVIAVDWFHGAMGYYTQCASNTRVVGAQIARLIRSLESWTHANRTDMHLVGHSLGAHVCGLAGKRIRGLGRITGLDPAGFGYKNSRIDQRLHQSDARFVDVIHTNGGSGDNNFITVGYLPPMGHADFYPNGGAYQPRCVYGSTCSHSIAYTYFTESIINHELAPLMGQACPSYEDYRAGRCRDCNYGCNPMGILAKKDEFRKSYYLDTEVKRVAGWVQLSVAGENDFQQEEGSAQNMNRKAIKLSDLRQSFAPPPAAAFRNDVTTPASSPSFLDHVIQGASDVIEETGDAIMDAEREIESAISKVVGLMWNEEEDEDDVSKDDASDADEDDEAEGWMSWLSFYGDEDGDVKLDQLNATKSGPATTTEKAATESEPTTTTIRATTKASATTTVSVEESFYNKVSSKASWIFDKIFGNMFG